MLCKSRFEWKDEVLRKICFPLRARRVNFFGLSPGNFVILVGQTFTLRDTASALLLADGFNSGFVPAHPLRCNGFCLLVLFFALADCLGLSLGRCVSDF